MIWFVKSKIDSLININTSNEQGKVLLYHEHVLLVVVISSTIDTRSNN
jgi:hypothetical protein